jgi:hypothetical protein
MMDRYTRIYSLHIGYRRVILMLLLVKGSSHSQVHIFLGGVIIF